MGLRFVGRYDEICYMTSVHPVFGTTLARRLNQSINVSVVLLLPETNCNLVQHGRNTTFELGLIISSWRQYCSFTFLRYVVKKHSSHLHNQ